MAEGRGQEDGTPKRGRGQEDGAQNPAVGCERGQGHLSPPQFPNSLPPFLSHCASPSPPPPSLSPRLLLASRGGYGLYLPELAGFAHLPLALPPGVLPAR